MKLLMHTCCAPCSVYCIETLREEGIEPTLFWYNPNIHPYKEYETRRDCLKEYSKKVNAQAIFIDEYGFDEFCKNTINDISGRCVNYCYPLRLEKTFQYAKENGFDTVTTTLLYSIYQKHDFIKAECERLSNKYGIDFLYRDFRVGYYKGHQKAYEEGLYLQKYCGCIFSEEEAFYTHNNNTPKMPDNYEFLPVERSIIIKKEKDNKEQYIDILLDADPSRTQIEKYLNSGELFVLTYKNELACIAIVQKVNDEICELKNLVTVEKFRNQGLAKKMIKYLFDNYKTTFKKMIVGTSENNIPFYVKQGFDKYEKTIKNFFIDNYDEEIWDGDLHCIDMYYYSNNLRSM